MLVVRIFARPHWYSIATSKMATTNPAINSVQPNSENSRIVSLIHDSSKISAPILPIMVKKSATAP